MDIDRLALSAKVLMDRRVLDQRREIEQLKADMLRAFFGRNIRSSRKLKVCLSESVEVDLLTWTGNEIRVDRDDPEVSVMTPRVFREDLRGKVLVTASLLRRDARGSGERIVDRDETTKLLGSIAPGYETFQISPQKMDAVEEALGLYVHTHFVGWVFDKPNVEGILQLHGTFAKAAISIDVYEGFGGTPLETLQRNDDNEWVIEYDIYDGNTEARAQLGWD